MSAYTGQCKHINAYLAEPSLGRRAIGCVVDAISAALPNWLDGQVRFESRRGILKEPVTAAVGRIPRLIAWLESCVHEKLEESPGPAWATVVFTSKRKDVSVVLMNAPQTIVRCGTVRKYGNIITIQMSEGAESAATDHAAIQILANLAAGLSVEYANGCLDSEYASQNLSLDGEIRALEWDLRCQLPGVYWMNYFGSGLWAELGPSTGGPAPDGWATRPVQQGELIVEDGPSDRWATSTGVNRRAELRRWLGEARFYDRQYPERDGALRLYRDR